MIISTRLADQTVDAGAATFVVVNADGWIVTAAHVLAAMQASAQHAKERNAFESARAAVLADAFLTVKARNRKLEQLKPNPKWITNQSLWWSQDGAGARQFFVDTHADIAIAKLDGFDISGISKFPVFHSPTTDPLFGSSLCRLGFPFASIKVTFNDQNKQFVMQQGLPPMFPNDGIHTRMAIAVDPSTQRSVKFIETSTPGLRGQSGGPLFDTMGRIWGIQSQTVHLELGFSPKVLKNGSLIDVKEHQFMHVGLSSHIQHVIDLFNQHGVQFNSVP